VIILAEKKKQEKGFFGKLFEKMDKKLEKKAKKKCCSGKCK
jgi:hypothetical protein